MLNLNCVQFVDAGRPAQPERQQPHPAARSTPASAAPILVGSHRDRPVDPDQRPAQVPAHLPGRRRSTRRSPASTRSCTARPGSSAPRTRSCPAATTGSSSTGSSSCSPAATCRAAPSGVTLNAEGAAGGVRRRSPAARARSSRSTRAPARSWRWPARPSYDPEQAQLATTRPRSRTAYQALRRRPGQAAANRPLTMTLPARARRSSSSPRPRRSRAASTRRTPMVPGPAELTLPADQPAAAELDRAALRPRRHDHADQRARRLVQHRVRRDRHEPRRRRAARAGREVRLQHAVPDAAAGRDEPRSRPTSTRRRPRSRRSASST